MSRYRSRFDPVTQPWERQADSAYHIGRHRAHDPISLDARRRTDRARALAVLDAAIDRQGADGDWTPLHDLRADVILSAGRRAS